MKTVSRTRAFYSTTKPDVYCLIDTDQLKYRISSAGFIPFVDGFYKTSSALNNQ